MKKLLLLTPLLSMPLLLSAGAAPRQVASTGASLEAAEAPAEETRSVTLDITGMT